MNLSRLTEEAFTGPGFMRALPGAEPRAVQIEMARTVAELADYGGMAVLEAGTGVGKSFAYLIPAVLSEKTALVSTATVTLQDQLINRDIPAVARILHRKIDARVLKGRSNYLCLRKFTLLGTGSFPEFERWAVESDGDLSSADPGLMPVEAASISGDMLDCPGSRCPDMHRCHYFRARREARNADLLVVNHHLLLCGAACEDLIPEAWLLVADEAHSLAAAASSILGHRIAESQMNGVFDAVSTSSADLAVKTALLEEARVITGTIAAVIRKAEEGEVPVVCDLFPILEELAVSAGRLRSSLEGNEELAGAAQVLCAIERAALAVAESDSDKWCVHVAGRGRKKGLRCDPVDPGPSLRKSLYARYPAVLLTSATLSAGGSFEYCDARLGIPDEAERRTFPSPFDYNANSVLALPETPVGHDDHSSLAREVWKVTRRAASILRGGTMALFTSYRNMELCVEYSRSDPLDGINVLVQGKGSRSAILDSFRADPRAVILGTASFWEGVDLPGETLQALVIDRIPFPSPGDPLTRARMRLLEIDGRSSFSSLMLPEAATRLKQGAGRLVRSAHDTGAVFILDPRMRKARYSGYLLRSLPPFRRCSLEEAMEFLEEHAPCR